MARRGSSFLEGLLYRRSLKRWSAMADAAAQADLATLRGWRGRARSLRALLDRVIHQADQRLARPLPDVAAPRQPMGTDWVWRPLPWQAPLAVPGLVAPPAKAPICEGATLFHDGQRPELTLRQLRASRGDDLAQYAIRLDALGFDGSFLSLALDLPDAAARGLKLRHLIRLEAVVETERKLDIFARLNIKHGPNVEQLLQEVPLTGGATMVEFDLAYSRMNEKRVEKLWLDLIFGNPQMNAITLRDVTLSRRPRADF